MPLAGDEELLRDFAIRACEHLDDADEHLLVLETDPLDAAAVDAVRCGLRRALSRASEPATPPILVAGRETDASISAVWVDPRDAARMAGPVVRAARAIAAAL